MSERLLLGLLTPSEILALLTLVLVVVTAYYAWQTQRTVQEMRRARSAAVLPRLAVSVKALGAGVGWPEVANIGPGPAIDAEVRLSFQPAGPQVLWRAHVVASGESRDLPAQDRVE